MKLSKTTAQKIVLEMMNVVPYNINVMDENGIIIGSGDIHYTQKYSKLQIRKN